MTVEPLSRRQLFERAQRRKSTLIAAASTSIIVLLVVVLIPKMPRWDRVRQSFFNAERFKDSFPRLLNAFVLDIKIFAWSVPFIVVLALLVAITRNSRSPALFPLRARAIAYTDIMRGVPVLLWIYLIGFGVPGLGMDRPWNSPLLWGSVALVLTYAAYVAEVAFRQQLKKQKGQKEVPKIPHPCKWLYADPDNERVFRNSVCAECWAHDYTDAKGIHKSPRKCEYLHPDEAGWKPEWNSLPVKRDKYHIPKAAVPAPAGGTTVYMSTRAAALAPKSKPKAESAW